MTNTKISDLLSTDVNNMFQHVVHRNEINTENIKRVQEAQRKEKSAFQDIHIRF